ncbi:hypothetical protein CISG_07659 [Coccidioides immitis RMSCC 3703]|uniref:CENP-V/GFA domain-containing protein n=2 Tax=Coccidioides immitis TaxID=5501 RepID=A0A0J8TZ08_COCIT|nr:DUF636 domain containing protein [Coccidioides immitis RMSCC 2394]KMU79227.1 hypothetical protein CISG_07659 [Coccidioides immitis RMSCC 3703]
MTSPIVFKGGCACSKVRYTSTVFPEWIGHCLCTTCRKCAGAPYQTFAGFPRSAITWTTEPPKYFRASDFAKRGFCDQCGSSLTFEVDSTPDKISLSPGSFDDWDVQGGKDAFVKPEGYIFAAEKAVWYELPNDGLPRHEKLPPAEAEKDKEAAESK